MRSIILWGDESLGGPSAGSSVTPVAEGPLEDLLEPPAASGGGAGGFGAGSGAAASSGPEPAPPDAPSPGRRGGSPVAPSSGSCTGLVCFSVGGLCQSQSMLS